MSNGGWAIAQSPILGTTIAVERLQKRGCIALSDMYNQLQDVFVNVFQTCFTIGL